MKVTIELDEERFALLKDLVSQAYEHASGEYLFLVDNEDDLMCRGMPRDSYLWNRDKWARKANNLLSFRLFLKHAETKFSEGA